MTVNRRNFLRSGAMTVLLTGLALDTLPSAFAQQSQKIDPSEDFRVPFAVKEEAIFYFKSETFRPYVGGVFKLRAGANSVEATLVRVRDCVTGTRSKLTPQARPTECFALVFSTEDKLTDLTTIYDVEHGALGKFALFLTLREGQRGTYFYEAVFNRPL